MGKRNTVTFAGWVTSISGRKSTTFKQPDGFCLVHLKEECRWNVGWGWGGGRVSDPIASTTQESPAFPSRAPLPSPPDV